MSDPAGSAKAAGVERWDVPAIDGSDGRGLVTAGQLQMLQKAAYDEAYQAGLEKGRKAGAQETARRVARLDQELALSQGELDLAREGHLLG